MTNKESLEKEVLNIIKNHSDIHLNSYVSNQLVIATRGLNCAYISLNRKELDIIKEWLENDK